MKKKKILFVVNYFYPDLASTGQLMTDLIDEINDEFDITIIAAQPKYAGELIDKKKTFESDNYKNSKVIRINLPRVNKLSKLSRLNYIIKYFIYAFILIIKERNVDVIYTISQPPILGGLLGTLGKLIKRKKHIYNVQDFNPEQAKVVNFAGNKLIYKLALEIDKINCRYADEIIVVGNDMQDTLIKRFKSKKIPHSSVINNWTNEEDIVPIPSSNDEIINFKIKNSLENKFIIMYSGNIGLYYDLENIIQIANELKSNTNIVFLFIGDGAIKKQLEDYVHKNNLQNVMFLPYQDKDYIKYSLNVADIHLVVNQKGIKGISVPSKIYGVMAAGKPILGVLEKGSEGERIISMSESGIVVEPRDYSAIRKAITKFYEMWNQDTIQNMGLKGRLYLEKNLTRAKSISKYREILKKI